MSGSKANSAPTRPPMLTPTIRSTEKPAFSNSSIAPRCAIPRAPPPPNASVARRPVMIVDPPALCIARCALEPLSTAPGLLRWSELLAGREQAVKSDFAGFAGGMWRNRHAKLLTFPTASRIILGRTEMTQARRMPGVAGVRAGKVIYVRGRQPVAVWPKKAPLARLLSRVGAGHVGLPEPATGLAAGTGCHALPQPRRLLLLFAANHLRRVALSGPKTGAGVDRQRFAAGRPGRRFAAEPSGIPGELVRHVD